MADLRGGTRIQGAISHDSPVSALADPVLVGGIADIGVRAPVQSGDASYALLDLYGKMAINLDPDTGNNVRVGGYNSLEVGERNLIMADYLADSIETARWLVTNSNGGTSTSASGEGLLQTSANANGATYIQTIEKIRYVPGISYEWGCEARIGNSIANNTKRIGIFTLSGTTPQDGYAFEFTGATPTVNIASYKGGTATTVASGSWNRNSVAPFTLDANLHRYAIIVAGSTVFFLIDGIVRHSLDLAVSTPRVATLIVSMVAMNLNVASAATNVSMGITGMYVAKFGDNQDWELPHVVQNKVAQYSTTQTGTALWTPASGKCIIVTYAQIQVGGTTAGTMQLWFGAGGDTTYTRGTDRAIFDGEWAPSTTLKPGIAGDAPTHGWKGNADEVLRVTDSAAINPLTVNVWGYEA